MKKVVYIITIITGFVLTSCNSNDDVKDFGINGITITDDADCCSAEEALAVYDFLQTLKPIDQLRLEVDGQYEIHVYARTDSLHVGYNDLYFVGTKKSTGNYIKFVNITNLTPLMFMSKMNMHHSTPVADEVTFLDTKLAAVKHGWVSFLMSTSENGSWTLSYDAEVLKYTSSLQATGINVAPLPNGQAWLKSFKVNEDTYFLSLANATDLNTGTNSIKAYVSKKSNPVTTPYAQATEQFIIEIDPRMPDMGNHTSPDNTSLTRQPDGSYKGTINLTMTGLWRIHLTVKDTQGNIVGGGDDLSEGYSSLFWDVTI